MILDGLYTVVGGEKKILAVPMKLQTGQSSFWGAKMILGGVNTVLRK